MNEALEWTTSEPQKSASHSHYSSPKQLFPAWLIEVELNRNRNHAAYQRLPESNSHQRPRHRLNKNILPNNTSKRCFPEFSWSPRTSPPNRTRARCNNAHLSSVQREEAIALSLVVLLRGSRKEFWNFLEAEDMVSRSIN